MDGRPAWRGEDFICIAAARTAGTPALWLAAGAGPKATEAAAVWEGNLLKDGKACQKHTVWTAEIFQNSGRLPHWKKAGRWEVLRNNRVVLREA